MRVHSIPFLKVVKNGPKSVNFMADRKDQFAIIFMKMDMGREMDIVVWSQRSPSACV